MCLSGGKRGAKRSCRELGSSFYTEAGMCHYTPSPDLPALLKALVQACLLLLSKCNKEQKRLHCFIVTVFTTVLNRHLLGPNSVPYTKEQPGSPRNLGQGRAGAELKGLR